MPPYDIFTVARKLTDGEEPAHTPWKRVSSYASRMAPFEIDPEAPYWLFGKADGKQMERDFLTVSISLNHDNRSRLLIHTTSLRMEGRNA